MENPRPEKVAVVNEVRERLDGAQAAILTEYRGLTVAEMAALRQALRGRRRRLQGLQEHPGQAGNRRRPPRGAGAPAGGPTAIAFVSGEVSAVAKALRDYARTNPNLVVKGGLHGEGFLSTQDLGVLADLPSRESSGPAGRGHRRPHAADGRPPAGPSPRTSPTGCRPSSTRRGGAPVEAAGRGRLPSRGCGPSRGPEAEAERRGPAAEAAAERRGPRPRPLPPRHAPRPRPQPPKPPPPRPRPLRPRRRRPRRRPRPRPRPTPRPRRRGRPSEPRPTQRA